MSFLKHCLTFFTDTQMTALFPLLKRPCLFKSSAFIALTHPWQHRFIKSQHSYIARHSIKFTTVITKINFISSIIKYAITKIIYHIKTTSRTRNNSVLHILQNHRSVGAFLTLSGRTFHLAGSHTIENATGTICKVDPWEGCSGGCSGVYLKTQA